MNIDLELDGVEDLFSDFQELKERGEGDAVYVTGTNVEYGIYLEMGTEHMPPYPWFRPAVREFKANPEKFIQDNTDFNSIDAIQTADELVATVAAALQNQMENNVNAQKSTDRSPGTHPEHPRRDTGNLTASIQAVRIN